MGTKEKILDLVRTQSLSSEELALWEEIVPNIPENFCADMLRFLESTPLGVRLLTDDFKEKIDIIGKQDMTQWEASLESMKTKVQALLSNK